MPKKNGSWRLVIDFKKLNRHTVPDRLHMPVKNDGLVRLGGHRCLISSLVSRLFGRCLWYKSLTI